MKRLVLMTWEQMMKLLEFCYEVARWLLPLVIQIISNRRTNPKKDNSEHEDTEPTNVG